MGVSYGDDTTRKCYSLTASWELGWCRRRTSINFGREPSFRGNLIGIVDYENPASNGKFVIVRAQSSTNTYEVYVGFNLAKGFNMDTIDGKDEATVTIHEDEGESTLMAGLNAGGSYRIADFQGKKGLNIKVHSINRNTVPAYADVEIYIDGCPVGSRSSACNACISNNDCIRGHSCVVGTCAAGTIAADPGDTFSLEYSSSSSSRGTTTNNFQTIRTFTMVMVGLVWFVSFSSSLRCGCLWWKPRRSGKTTPSYLVVSPFSLFHIPVGRYGTITRGIRTKSRECTIQGSDGGGPLIDDISSSSTRRLYTTHSKHTNISYC